MPGKRGRPTITGGTRNGKIRTRRKARGYGKPPALRKKRSDYKGTKGA